MGLSSCTEQGEKTSIPESPSSQLQSLKSVQQVRHGCRGKEQAEEMSSRLLTALAGMHHSTARTQQHSFSSQADSLLQHHQARVAEVGPSIGLATLQTKSCMLHLSHSLMNYMCWPVATQACPLQNMWERHWFKHFSGLAVSFKLPSWSSRASAVRLGDQYFAPASCACCTNPCAGNSSPAVHMHMPMLMVQAFSQHCMGELPCVSLASCIQAPLGHHSLLPWTAQVRMLCMACFQQLVCF